MDKQRDIVKNIKLKTKDKNFKVNFVKKKI